MVGLDKEARWRRVVMSRRSFRREGFKNLIWKLISVVLSYSCGCVGIPGKLGVVAKSANFGQLQ
jgi:hypothetical protein